MPTLSSGALFLNNPNRLPAFFIGHGSPMNALEKNAFTAEWRNMFTGLTGVRALLMVSAHWVTHGTQVTAMPQPRTIHDFGGFPRELYQVSYPAPGSAEIAQEVIAALEPRPAKADTSWGLDHGTWSILVHALPDAKIPVLQLSIDGKASPADFFAIGRSLRPLREQGILLCGSGNIVHNLSRVDWSRLDETGFAHDWAKEAAEISRGYLLNRDWQKLVDFPALPQSMQIAINTAEHYVPLIYMLGAAYEEENLRLFNDTPVGGALTMTSVQFG
ncbi:MAG TPA: 4,5-DOPA dioxygenase extradiol [Turneriella sp.]|nr:4,5-DOPA dioxygenase extradiol [Turneriella sp.]HNL11896.1 4,5-DOPA dioxygenase extradiol [Turneriella sp.]HNL54408.1 4,5-DOPA dioxygenase extradiol [Turneriella sp.]HNN00058.1 4,5-DOPA dioxygenase extradiol [Turneriella sp.]